MSREEMCQQIYYSYRLENMFSKITGRIDRLLSFFILLLGSSVIASYGNPVFIGLSVAGISALKLSFAFEAASGNAKKQSARYLRLFNTSDQVISANELRDKMADIQDDDGHVWEVLINPAWLKTCSHLGIHSTIKLSRRERIISIIAG